MEMCRACLITGMEMVSMDENFLIKYNKLTNLALTMADMPLYTCYKCYAATKFSVEFREKCIASDKTLKEILLPNKRDINEEVIQEESGDEKVEGEFKAESSDDDAELLNEYYNYREEYVEPKPKRKPKPKTEPIAKKPQRDRVCKNKITKEVEIDVKLHCGLCPKILESHPELTDHLDQHKDDFACSICSESIINVSHMYGHRMNHVPKKQQVCHLCNKRFFSAENLEFHCMKIHEMADKDAPIQCKMCLSSFKGVKQLQKHIQGHKERTFKCDHCPKSFRYRGALQVHMGKHNTKRMFQCDLCDYTCKYHTGIANHKLRKHTADKAVCKTCGRVFPSQQLLDKHNCRHGQAASCTICGITFQAKGKYSINQHMKLHGEAQFKCTKCPATFRSRGNYIAHIDKHEGTPRHQCSFCDRPFYSQSVLIKHRRTHTGEKPYVCTICNKGFTGNHNLKVHMRVHGIVNLIRKKDTPEDDKVK